MRLLKRLALTISILTTSIQIFSQDFDKVYFNSDWALTSIDKAVYYRKSDFNAQIPSYDGTVTDYYFDTDQIEMTGQYVNGLKSGTFHFYYPNGKLKTVANYRENKRIGNWKAFYRNGVLKLNIEHEDNIEKILELNDSLGNSLIKRNRLKHIFTYIEAPGPFFGFDNYPNDETYEISGALNQSLRHGRWTVKNGNRLIATLRYSFGRMEKGFFHINGQRVPMHSEFVFPLIFDPIKFQLTESFVFEPGAIIKNNYVMQGLHEYKYKSMKKVTIKSYEELEQYVNNHFDFMAKQQRLIEIHLETSNGVITSITAAPKLPASAMNDLQLLFDTIEKLEFDYNKTITVLYNTKPFENFGYD